MAQMPRRGKISQPRGSALGSASQEEIAACSYIVGTDPRVCPLVLCHCAGRHRGLPLHENVALYGRNQTRLLCLQKWGDTRGNCALQGQNHKTCRKGFALSGQQWGVAYSTQCAVLGCVVLALQADSAPMRGVANLATSEMSQYQKPQVYRPRDRCNPKHKKRLRRCRT